MTMDEQQSRICEAPGCDKPIPKKYGVLKARARFCSNDCRTNWGAWSYPATRPTLERVYGVTKV